MFPKLVLTHVIPFCEWEKVLLPGGICSSALGHKSWWADCRLDSSSTCPPRWRPSCKWTSRTNKAGVLSASVPLLQPSMPVGLKTWSGSIYGTLGLSPHLADSAQSPADSQCSGSDNWAPDHGLFFGALAILTGFVPCSDQLPPLGLQFCPRSGPIIREPISW